MPNMRKKIAVLVVVFAFSFTQNARAFDPVVIPSAFLGAMALGAAGGLYYAMRTGSIPSVDITGSVSRAAAVAYVAIDSVTKAPSVVMKNLTASKSFDHVMSVVASKPFDYPNLKAASASSADPVPSSLQSGAYVKEYYSNSGTYRVVRYDKRNYNTWSPSSPAPQDGTANTRIHYDYYGGGRHMMQVGSGWKDTPGDTGFGVCDFYEVQSVSGVSDDQLVNPLVPLTPSKFASKLASDGLSGSVSSPYQSELDAMMKDQTYVPTFTDDSTGLPFAYPPGVLTPSQVEAYNQTGVAADKRAVALDAARDAVIGAQNIYDAAQSRLAGNPTDPVLIAAADRAKLALDKAKTDAANIEASNATTDARGVERVADAESVSGFTLPAVRSFSWASLESLKGVMSTAFPFYLIPRLGSLYGQIVPEEPTAPSFSLPVFGQTYSISLSMFDPLAMAIRSFIAVAASAAAIVAMVKFYRG